jgi:hypothetical protein
MSRSFATRCSVTGPTNNSWPVLPFDSYEQPGRFSRKLTTHRRVHRQTSRLAPHDVRYFPQGLGLVFCHPHKRAYASLVARSTVNDE